LKKPPRFEGKLKAHVAIDPDSEVITATTASGRQHRRRGLGQ
jgi:hypothetical protein